MGDTTATAKIDVAWELVVNAELEHAHAHARTQINKSKNTNWSKSSGGINGVSKNKIINGSNSSGGSNIIENNSNGDGMNNGDNGNIIIGGNNINVYNGNIIALSLSLYFLLSSSFSRSVCLSLFLFESLSLLFLPLFLSLLFSLSFSLIFLEFISLFYLSLSLN
jgi:hypothetical protein